MKEICFETIDSTNAYLKSHYADLDNFTIVSANTQTNGKGRNNRTWVSDNNNLLFSLLIKDKNYFDKYKSLSIISAYSVLKVLEQYGINDISIKWPNDVYINDKKVCGILLEAISKQELQCLIIGVGINVNQDRFIGEYLNEPISIKQVIKKDINIDELKNKVYDRLISNIVNIDSHDFYEEICEYDYLKNKEVYAEIFNQKQLVRVLGINDDYSLKVQSNNKVLNIETGEISFHV